MKITVFGAGALGSLLGAILSRAHDVTLVGRPEHADAIRRNGLVVEGTQGFTARPRAVERASPSDPCDLVLFTVKAYDTARVIDEIQPLMRPGTIFVTAQNGLGNWEAAATKYPNHAVLAASVTYGASLVAPGRVRWGGIGEILVVGSPRHSKEAERVIQAFRAGNLNVQAAADVQATLWQKAIVNAAINPLTAIARVPNGTLLDDPALRERMRRVCAEAAAVAKAEGIRLPADPFEAAQRVARATSANRSSMLQSIERGQRTEIDAITGKILEAARRHGIACPENEDLFAQVRNLENKRASR